MNAKIAILGVGVVAIAVIGTAYLAAVVTKAVVAGGIEGAAEAVARSAA